MNNNYETKRPKKPKRYKDGSKTLFDIFFGSKVGFAMVLINIYMFWFVNFTVKGYESLDLLILYPANLFKGNLLCILASGFIHLDWTHLFLNLFGIIIFTRIVEKNLGPLKTFYIYVGALLISMTFSTVINYFILEKNIAIVGASGALMGIIAAAMILDPFYVTYDMIFPIPIMFKGWMFIYADLKGFLSASRDGVSYLSHLIGYLSVAFLVYFLSKRDKTKMRTGLIINIISFLTFLLLRYLFDAKIL